MAFRVDPSENLAKEVRRVAEEQIEKARAEGKKEDSREAAHAVRKRLKKIRALLRLVRPELGDRYGHENVRFRDAGRLLAPIRDATALCEAVQALEENSGESFKPAAKGLDERRLSIEDRIYSNGDPFKKVSGVLDEALSDIKNWRLKPDGDRLPRGLEKSYRRGWKAMAKARTQPLAPNLHDWRKRAKYHRYHCRLLEGVWKAPFAAREDETHDLTDLLGEHHDLSELERIVLEDPSRFGGYEEVEKFMACLGRRRAEATAEALRLGSKIYAEKPKTLTRRLAQYWQVAAS